MGKKKIVPQASTETAAIKWIEDVGEHIAAESKIKSEPVREVFAMGVKVALEQCCYVAEKIREKKAVADEIRCTAPTLGQIHKLLAATGLDALPDEAQEELEAMKSFMSPHIERQKDYRGKKKAEAEN